MPVRYLVSSVFDAKQEAERLLVRFSNPGRDVRLHAVIDVLHSLNEAEQAGFVGIAHKWEKTVHDDLFVYSHVGILAAINVPGSGRAQTYDVTLLGVAFIEEGRDEQSLVKEFLAAMNDRRRTGASHDWH